MTTPVGLVVNARSRRKYDRLVSMIEHVRIVLEDARRVVGQVQGLESGPVGVVTVEELMSLVKRAESSLEVLQGRVRRGQADLMAQEWRF
ncbi:hypothetical protein LWF15_02995 [Kineosporia rhizophila]|uniref:hypothetical protein n=1 Tax=Kineosporia TaxID=49184 RepID=UPI000B14F498|nr:MULTISPECIES: hypothetical protein [Kineosporia]MCE0534465.1 hypothetical protein [Kineosporia rhizophila]GLY13999.1 hypothetical protein Kisp01_10150 [Kineosporia sp. NBRC 101677]